MGCGRTACLDIAPDFAGRDDVEQSEFRYAAGMIEREAIADTRAAIARFVVDGGPDAETVVIVNNKAEGSAPRSVFALAEAIAGSTAPNR